MTGDLHPASNYLINIKSIDQRVRETVVPEIQTAIKANRFGGGAAVVLKLLTMLDKAWPGIATQHITLWMSPFFSISAHALELPMVRLSQKFEFSASHRLFNPALSEEENLRTFGKCSNPHGHGHNYELQVTLAGEPNANGVLIDVPAFERIVAETVIERFDHKNLNVQVPEFASVIPSVENIAQVIYRLLQPRFARETATLKAVTIWETQKTWCEYSE